MREVNERVAHFGFVEEDQPIGFVCECSDPSCAEHINLEPSEYEKVKKRGPILAPCHIPK